MKAIPKDILDRIEWRSTGEMKAAVPVPKRITHEPKPCDDCGMTVIDRRIEYRQRINPELHWAQKCENCNLLKHPETGVFEVKSSQYQAIYKAYIAERDK